MTDPRELRKGQGMSRRELSGESGVSPHAIAAIERGERTLDPGTARKLAAVLACEPWRVVYETEDEFRGTTLTVDPDRLGPLTKDETRTGPLSVDPSFGNARTVEVRK